MFEEDLWITGDMVRDGLWACHTGLMNELSETKKCFGMLAAGDPVYAAYHDTEWGRPVRDDTGMFERICLEGFQVGLSWRTVLHKRDAFREAFRGFDPAVVARFGEEEIERLLTDVRIIRNRAKITACVRAAGIVEAMKAGGESLAELVWSYKPVEHRRPAGVEDLLSQTPESVALAADLHKRGFRFVGPVNMYATLQACGVVNDHLVGCEVGDAIDADG